MSNKRSVSTDALETLGNVIDEKKEKRDAIYLAVIPMVATQRLFPGEDVGLVDGGAGRCDDPKGIVDPFLKGPVKAGQGFWMVLYPRMVTSLRHVWSHPAFADEAGAPAPAPAVAPPPDAAQPDVTIQVDMSRRALEALARKVGWTYERLIEQAHRYAERGESYVEHDGEGMRSDFGDMGEKVFWTHFENVTGMKVTEEKRGTIFDCSC